MEMRRDLQLFLLRHADAGDPEAWTGNDAARPLSDKGRRQAERLGAFLARIGFEPDVILTSPKVRARETAEIVAAAIGKDVVLDERLGGSFDIAGIRGLLGDHDNPARPVLVGHDPDFSDLLAELCAADSLQMRKGAIARVDLPDGIAPGAGVLRWLIPPDALKPRG